MKRILFFLWVYLLYCPILLSQVALNSDGTPPDSSAMLDVKAADRGILIPRLTSFHRNDIPSPAAGLLIFNLTTKLFNYFDGSYWYKLDTAFVTSTTGFIRPGGGFGISQEENVIPDSSAILDLNNSSRGFLIPRTTPDLIPDPSRGLLIYNASTHLLNYFNGDDWIGLCANNTGIPGATGTQASMGLAINTGGSDPHPSAILDISAPDKGILLPRLSDVQRDSVFPVTGLTIYNISSDAIEYYSGSGWYRLIMTIPGTPAEGTHDPSKTQIVWKWQTVGPDARYKWNVSDEFGTATDMGTNTSFTETGLTCNSSYTRFVWAYNTCGASSSVTLSEITSACSGPCGQAFTDSRDGKVYNTVGIGIQCWMQQNLNIGTSIAGTRNQSNNDTIEKYCYGNLETSCDVYGGLYQWGEVVQYTNGASNETNWDPIPTGNIRGICPDGWHLPSYPEWCILIEFIHGPFNCNYVGWTATDAGGKMKEEGITHWKGPNQYATNSSGFTAFGAGVRNVYGSPFAGLPPSAMTGFWTRNEELNIYAFGYYLYNSSGDITRIGQSRKYGLSVRCLRDE
ncbi:MAG: FISUMP domain-containing protein [Bacteroidota bacterium]